MQEKNNLLFYSKWELGLVHVFLIKTAPSSCPVIDIFFFCSPQVFLLKKNLSFHFSQVIILDPNLEWWPLVVGIREYNYVVKKTHEI